MRQVVESEAGLDPGKLIVSHECASGETGDDVRLDPDMLDDMIEHDGGQKLAAPHVANRITQAAQLQRMAESERE